MWDDRQQRDRERHWPSVERLFGTFPPILSSQTKLLEYDLALRYSPTGQFRDIFTGAGHFPLLSLAGWLSHDLSDGGGPRHERAEGHLFRAAVLVAARTHTLHSILDATTFYDAGHVALVQLLSERVTIELALAAPRSSRLWDVQAALAAEDVDGTLAQRQARRGPAAQQPEPGDCLRPRWSGPARLLARGALASAGRLDTVPEVDEVLHETASAFEIIADLSSIHTDMLAGRPTFPIAFVARATGTSLEPWPEPTHVLGALVATNSLDGIVDAAVSRLRESHRRADDLGLSTVAAFLLDAAAALDARRPRPARGKGVQAGRSRTGSAAAPLVTLVQPTLTKALDMAEGFLLADPTFKESWEAHREGMFGSSLVASRFPAGLILEILSARGQDVSAPVEAFLAFTEANRFRYYDHPWSHIDSDTLGVYLRLRAGAAPPREGEAAAAVMACLERHVATTGRLPVWITDCEESPRERPFMLDLGEGCGTVVAHLLLGLLADAPDRHRATIELGALQLFEQIQTLGPRANVNYPPVYALAVFGRLMASLHAAGSQQVKRGATKALHSLDDALERALARRVVTAQQAALLTLACRHLNRLDRIDRSWHRVILQEQRSDGSWIGEPFAAAPNRGLAVSWYSSSLLTTALCYDALATSSP